MNFVLRTFALVVLLVATDMARGERPNIILLLTDDMRADCFGAAGNAIIETPHIDRLAHDGVRFTEAFVTTAICATSRASYLTGQYASRHGIHDFAQPIDDAAWQDTFPARLRAAGYHTAFVGKWGLGGPLPQERYDYFAGFSGQGRYYEPDDPRHMTQRLTDAAEQFLTAYDGDAPYFLQLSYKAPHCQDGAERQFQPDRRLEGMYTHVAIPPAERGDEASLRRLPEFLQTSEGRVRWHLRFDGDEMYQANVKDYYRLVSGIDRSVGRILELLAERGDADNTVIVFTSDHGFLLGEHGLAGKWFMFDESIRVPLVVHDPRAAASRHGATVDLPVLNIDVAPTLLALADVAVPPAMQGTSLVPLVAGETPPWRDDWYYEHRFEHPRIAKSDGVRNERWKYVRYDEVSPVYEQLFDLENDPGEEHNLIDDPAYASTLTALRERCDELKAAAK
ncbi:MAG: sulfatase [Planctomycetales bacterium]|nr:sulfatase [Planctomycetales bacterium]